MVYSSLAEYADLNRNAELNVSNDAFSASMLPVSCTTASQPKLSQQNRVPPLKNLCIGDSGVGHMRVHTIGAVPRWASARSACDSLVVAEPSGRRRRIREITAKAESEIVTITLRGRTGVEASKDDVRDTLTLTRSQSRQVLHIEGNNHTVRTLPPTTAALSDGDRKELGGMRTSIGLRQP